MLMCLDRASRNWMHTIFLMPFEGRHREASARQQYVVHSVYGAFKSGSSHALRLLSDEFQLILAHAQAYIGASADHSPDPVLPAVALRLQAPKLMFALRTNT